ncbi:methyl-accepting chemotaxis protein [Calothrix sp. 336/3]|uniref:methyl-accepting chemotaxis protein n=1 Tax=Calothrix sp. 336/3 TaxID=1337936 RepID=UPI0004E3970F|nr:methyl-accepting chemotaxis protein [Calothrix sp. 336/3]AKG23758.1 hypothetical protein IJ00_22880 [Calothrix sp. 336/3]
MNNKVNSDETQVQTSQPRKKYRGNIVRTNNRYDELALKILTKTPVIPDETPEMKPSLWERFTNLPIGRKQLIVLLASELLSIFVISSIGRLLITHNLDSLSLEQAKSEVMVSDINYNIKINQMGFGFRGQADNAAIIKAASIYNSGQTLNPEDKNQVKQILQNEIQARKIEYATLVGKDLKIIVNANADRTGEIFNPDNLVQEVFNYPRQIKVNSIVKSSEILREAPPLPNGVNRQDFLIRYTVTPVRDLQTRNVIGALVSGDIVNGKIPITKATLKATGGGYSAIYLRKPTGELSLVTSLYQGASQNINQAETDVALPPEGIALLRAATVTDGKPVAGKLKIGQQTYAIAAKAVPNKIIETEDEQLSIFGDAPVGILVRGTPQTTLNQLLGQSFWLELLSVYIAVIIILMGAYVLRRSIITPIQNLRLKAQSFATGDRTVRADVFAIDEIGQIAVSFNAMADSIVSQSHSQQNESYLTQLVNEINIRCRSSLNTQYILNTAVNRIRDALKTDRVIVYQFNPSWEGRVVAESVAVEFPVAIGAEINDSCFTQKSIHKYQQGTVLNIDNVETANLTECHLNLLKRFGIKANLVAPIVINNQLYGLLIAHQCSTPRNWQEVEINFLKQVAVPIAYALEKAALQEQIQQVSSQVESISQEKSLQQATIYQQIEKILQDIEHLSQGDLTVQTDVIPGEMSFVGEYINNTISNLRAIATKIQVSAQQVNSAIVDNDTAMSQFADTNLQQSAEIKQTLSHVEQFTVNLKDLLESTQQSATESYTIVDAAQENEVAIEMNLQNLRNLRTNIDDMAKKIKRLGESSQQLSRIIFLINQIAMQSNLLAVNAGLEIAREGKEEQNFAIVAEEVGELATHCTEATQEIEKIIENIQKDAQLTIKSMESGTIQVIESSHNLEITKQKLNQMLQVSQQVHELVQNISQSTTYKLTISEDLINAIENISHALDVNSHLSQEISQSLNQTVDISQELQESVAGFKTYLTLPQKYN